MNKNKIKILLTIYIAGLIIFLPIMFGILSSGSGCIGFICFPPLRFILAALWIVLYPIISFLYYIATTASANKTSAQVSKFSLVGIINTFIDYVILNVLVYLGFVAVITIFGQKFLVANIISVFVAMINSFILNKQWTFKSTVEGVNLFWEIAKFLVITIIGMFVVHQLVFNVFYFNIPSLFSFISHFIGLDKLFSDQFVILNGAKSIAIVVSLVWNFIGYKFVVFNKSSNS